MNEWEAVAAVLGASIVPCLAVCMFARVTDALAAMELAGTLLSAALMALCEGIQRQPFMDLALLFALLSMVGALVFARLMEQGLGDPADAGSMESSAGAERTGRRLAP